MQGFPLTFFRVKIQVLCFSWGHNTGRKMSIWCLLSPIDTGVLVATILPFRPRLATDSTKISICKIPFYPVFSVIRKPHGGDLRPHLYGHIHSFSFSAICFFLGLNLGKRAEVLFCSAFHQPIMGKCGAFFPFCVMWEAHVECRVKILPQAPTNIWYSFPFPSICLHFLAQGISFSRGMDGDGGGEVHSYSGVIFPNIL